MFISPPRLLVGSPLGKNLQLGTTRSGALFKCPISDDASDCEQVSTDTGVASKYLDFAIKTCMNTVLIQTHVIRTDITSEEKENQWLGVTVRSGGVGGKVSFQSGFVENKIL